ncbi:hypothetical protein CPCC7001_1900 [Cyanobium sp. PCC 7001]|uniref:hypothetical protein n=1 Tax=Cyanobium sp. PCC 7001 TaxID=180281 RepID=UPI0001804AE8|nr:hypothetical protein [Cyanobium sp. PCC 7001]EDY39021.1 hypothetical protein CPCC7001_1900 [Cyanobium sp. PCC 7001]
MVTSLERRSGSLPESSDDDASSSPDDFYAFSLSGLNVLAYWEQEDTGAFLLEDLDSDKTFRISPDLQQIEITELKSNGRTKVERLQLVPGLSLPGQPPGTLLYQEVFKSVTFGSSIGSDDDDKLRGKRGRADVMLGFGGSDRYDGKGCFGRKGKNYDHLIDDSDSSRDVFVIGKKNRSYYEDRGLGKGKGLKKGAKDTFALIEGFDVGTDRLASGFAGPKLYRIGRSSALPSGMSGLPIVSKRNPNDLVAVLDQVSAANINSLF